MEIFDTHRAVKELQAAGFGDSQAEALVNTIGGANAALRNFATKEDLKVFATKKDLKAFATKEDLKAFATKEDLKAFATKEDLSALSDRFEERIATSMVLLEQRLTIKFGVGVVAIVGAMVAMLRGLEFLTG